MLNTETFVDRCLRGAAVPDEIDDYVEKWHAGTLGQGMELRDLLGMDRHEYTCWARDGRDARFIVNDRKTGAHVYGRLPVRGFPEIEQLRHVVADVRHAAEYIGQDEAGKPQYDPSRRKPALVFRGTAKLHGTSCGIAFDLVNHATYAQTRERYLTVGNDNFGFCAWTLAPETAVDVAQLRHAVLAAATDVVDQAIVACRAFGEWCGPSVNGKTGIGQLSSRWVVFAALVTLADGTEHWLSAERVAAAWARLGNGQPRADGSRLYFISDFQQWEVIIDFNEPEVILDELERLTLEVEADCPVAKAMGGAGIGEGIVWTCQDAVYGRHTFKTKGTKHKGTKNSRLVQIEPEVLAGIEAFTDAVLTDSRLEQGFERILAEHGKVTEDHIGIFLQWVGQDVVKEESDTLEASGLERKQVMRAVNHRAKAWLMPRLARV